MKFKVGDKVVVSPKANPLLGGLSGIVIETQESPIANTTYYKVDLDEERVFPEHHLIAETEYRFLTEPNATAHQLLATCGIKAADSDTKVLRAKDGTIIGDFSTGGVVSIHDLPTSEWYNPMRLTFKNGSSIEVLPQKGDAVRGENHFCNGFKGGKIPTPSKPISIEEQLGLPKGVSIHDLDMTSLYRPMNIEIQPLELVCDEEQAKNIAERLAKELNGMLGVSFTKKEEKKMSTKFTFYTIEGYRMDKSNNTKIPTMTTEVLYKDKDGCAKGGSATCDKADYDERQGCLEALANMCCGGNFDREYNKAVRYNKKQDIKNRTCLYCGQVFDTFKERLAHEAWHVERKKARRERYKLRKRAKEIAFEQKAQEMAKEMIDAKKGDK